MKQVAPLAWVTNFATLSTSMSSTHIITSNIISICIKNRQSHTNKIFKLYSSPYQSTCQSPCRSPHLPPCQPPWPAPQSPPLTSSWVSSIARVSSVKSSVGIFTHRFLEWLTHSLTLSLLERLVTLKINSQSLEDPMTGTLRIKQLRHNTLCFRTFQAWYTMWMSPAASDMSGSFKIVPLIYFQSRSQRNIEQQCTRGRIGDHPRIVGHDIPI